MPKHCRRTSQSQWPRPRPQQHMCGMHVCGSEPALFSHCREHFVSSLLALDGFRPEPRSRKPSIIALYSWSVEQPERGQIWATTFPQTNQRTVTLGKNKFMLGARCVVTVEAPNSVFFCWLTLIVMLVPYHNTLSSTMLWYGMVTIS